MGEFWRATERLPQKTSVVDVFATTLGRLCVLAGDCGKLVRDARHCLLCFGVYCLAGETCLSSVISRKVGRGTSLSITAPTVQAVRIATGRGVHYPGFTEGPAEGLLVQR